MNTNKIPLEIICRICDFLENDCDKINLLLTCKNWSRGLTLISRNNIYSHHLVKDKKYYNQIQYLNIVMRTPNVILPNNLKKLYINNAVIPANTEYEKIGNMLCYKYSRLKIEYLILIPNFDIYTETKIKNINAVYYSDFPIIVKLSTDLFQTRRTKFTNEYTISNIDDLHNFYNYIVKYSIDMNERYLSNMYLWRKNFIIIYLTNLMTNDEISITLGTLQGIKKYNFHVSKYYRQTIENDFYENKLTSNISRKYFWQDLYYRYYRHYKSWFPF